MKVKGREREKAFSLFNTWTSGGYYSRKGKFVVLVDVQISLSLSLENKSPLRVNELPVACSFKMNKFWN